MLDTWSWCLSVLEEKLWLAHNNSHRILDWSTHWILGILMGFSIWGKCALWAECGVSRPLTGGWYQKVTIKQWSRIQDVGEKQRFHFIYLTLNALKMNPKRSGSVLLLRSTYSVLQKMPFVFLNWRIFRSNYTYSDTRDHTSHYKAIHKNCGPAGWHTHLTLWRLH